GKYNETQLRLDFLNPLFEALGWDVSNRKGYAERYREVILEPSVEMEGQAKAADYAFRVGDKTLFFVEAKKPAVNIGANPEPAFQVRRYGWSAKLSISILSDFEQLAVYDCRIKPSHGDPAALGRVKLYSFQEYAEKWDEISAIFSRQAVLKGSFDQYAEGLKGKRGTADVDDAFLEEMERWRGDLARNIALRNPTLSSRELNSAVQTTIDRIIFLRICEECGIEAEDALRNATDGKDVYQDLVQLFKQADKKYNSGLFHFSDEKGQASYPDTLTLGLKIDDKVLKGILAHLYYPLSPYAFKYIPVAILGQVYERFLGKVIRLTAGHQAKVEEKPEVRKAGGVYYTPTYIVEYIVRHTLGELLRGASPVGDKDPTAESQKNQPLRVLDPACGSGSFLLGAYQYLLDWYLDWYIHNDPARWSKGKVPAVVESQGGWQLTMDKKKEILLSHIYGVDIDAQAVEVTKLSLLLKVVENPGQLSWLNERILPDLGENIKCGNSLIGPDYYDGRQMPIFGDEEFYRVNVFDWHKAFPQVFAAGGFDAVIGNPPYRKERDSKDLLSDLSKSKYGKRYYQGKMDFWYFFLHLAIDLARKNGVISFIVPSYWLSSTGASRLIIRLKENIQFSNIVNFADNKIFENVSGKHMIFVANKSQNDSSVIYQSFKDHNLSAIAISTELNEPLHSSNIEVLTNVTIYTEDNKINLNIGNYSNIFEKISPLCFLLEGGGDSFEVSQGIVEAPDIVSRSISQRTSDFSHLGEGVFVIPQSTFEQYEFNNNELPLLKKYLRSTDVRRYYFEYSNYYVFYIGSKENKNVLSKKKDFPNITKHLDKYKKFITSSNSPYGIHRTRESRFFTSPKIIGQNMFDKPSFVYCEQQYYVNFAFNVVINNCKNYDLRYLLGILNSQFGEFWFNLHAKKRGVNNDLGVGVLRTFPVRTINFSDPADAARHARMVTLVEGMLALHKQAAAARLPQEKEMIQRQMQATDAQIDRLVYELYELTEEEIKIVEGE
ncbi:MAG: N-6 DNA methylase, partial [Planctomycetes bacterium]|nr:N-6 DNA methylase [Planctomycetota bacterium]